MLSYRGDGDGGGYGCVFGNRARCMMARLIGSQWVIDVADFCERFMHHSQPGLFIRFRLRPPVWSESTPRAAIHSISCFPSWTTCVTWRDKLCLMPALCHSFEMFMNFFPLMTHVGRHKQNKRQFQFFLHPFCFVKKFLLTIDLSIQLAPPVSIHTTPFPRSVKAIDRLDTKARMSKWSKYVILLLDYLH